jgi:hypothetical protein
MICVPFFDFRLSPGKTINALNILINNEDYVLLAFSIAGFLVGDITFDISSLEKVQITYRILAYFFLTGVLFLFSQARVINIFSIFSIS